MGIVASVIETAVLDQLKAMDLTLLELEQAGTGASHVSRVVVAGIG